MKRILIGNFFLRLGVHFIERVAGLVVVPILIARIDVDGYGYYGLANGVILLFVNILCLRFTMAMIRFYPGDRGEAGSVVMAGLLYWVGFAAFTSAAVAIAPARMAELAFADPGKQMLLVLSVAAGLLTTLYEFVTATLRAENRLALMSGVDAGERLLFIGGCVLALWIWQPTVELVLIVLIAGTTLRLAVMSYPALRGLKLRLPDARLFGSMLLFCLPFLPYLASVWLIERSPFFFVAQRLGAESTGILMLAFTLASVLAAVTSPLQTTLFPMLSRAFDQNRVEDVREYMSIALRMTVSFCAFGSLTLVIGTRPLLEILGIEAATPPRLLGGVMCLALSLGALRQLVINLLHVEKKTASLVWVAIVGAGVAAATSALLLPPLGLVGAAAGMAAGTLVQVIAMTRYASMRLVAVPTRGYLFALAASLLAALVIQLVCLQFGARIYLVGVCVSTVVVAISHFLLGGVSDAERQALRARLDSMRGKALG
jgi:O-antigen/teichoic acid export membrane protein